MFYGSDFRKETRKMTLKTLFEASKLVKKSRNDVKVPVFLDVLCLISAIFDDFDLNFFAHIHQPLPSNILYGFFREKIDFEREKFLKEKIKLKILEFFGIFKIFKNPR